MSSAFIAALRLVLTHFSFVDWLDSLLPSAPIPPTFTKTSIRHDPTTQCAYSPAYQWLRYRCHHFVYHVILLPMASVLQSWRTPPIPPLTAPPWPEPSFDHLLGMLNPLPYRLEYSSNQLAFDIDTADIVTTSLPDPFSSIEDATDEHALGLLKVIDDYLDLSAAGFHFSFVFRPLGSIPYERDLHPSWLEFEQKMQNLVCRSRPVSWSSIASAFLHDFSPAEAARAIIRPSMFSYVEGRVSIDLSRSFTRLYPVLCYNIKLKHIPLIVDSGASVCITPERSDFQPGTYRESNMKVRDLSSENEVLGEGSVLWPVVDTLGQVHVIELPCLHIPTAGVRLLSPQVLKHRHNIGGSIEDDGIHLLGDNNVRLVAKYNSTTNLPELQLSDLPMSNSVWSDTFGDMNTHLAAPSAHLSVIDVDNSNLTPSEKELLLWHQRLSHTNLAKVRLLCMKRQWVRLDAVSPDALTPDAILPTREDATSRVATQRIKCASCCMAKQHRRTTPATSRSISTQPEMALKTSHLSPGMCISVDHYVSPVRGRHLKGFGTTTCDQGYTGGSIFVDHASGMIFHYPQVDLSATTTIRAKQHLEALAKDVDVSIKAYHSDNGVFASKEFRNHCSSQRQKLSFSGVGAHHQNGVAERSIQTVSKMARSNLLHLMLHWPTQCKLDLWALSMDYAVWIYNRIPRESLGGLTSDEFWSGTRTNHNDLKRAHVFGCPVYVLDPKLQDGKPIPKWNSRSQQGMFVGYSKEHSSMVPLVLNLATGHISPQFHVIFDDSFHTVPSLHADVKTIDDTFTSLYDNGTGSSCERFVDPDEVSEGDSPFQTELDSDPDPMGNPFYAPEGAVTLDIEADSDDDPPSNPPINLHDFDPPTDPADPPNVDPDPVPLRRSQRSDKARRPPHKPDFVYTLLPLAASLSTPSQLASWAQPPPACTNLPHLPSTYKATATMQ